MSRFHSYINSSKRIIDTYDAEHPFPFHLKKQFAANKQFGSRDRKMIAEICYAWFRTSHLFNRNLQDTNIIGAIFLCARLEHPLLAALAPELNEMVALSSVEKLAHLNLKPSGIFPFEDALGAVDSEQFFLSFLNQPLLFLRLRPGQEEVVLNKLKTSGINFDQPGGNCIALPNATKIEDQIALNREAVVQDYNSQRVFNYFDKEVAVPGKVKVWDCCAASGGKSILLYDKLDGKISLTVSDIRETIMHNCKRRLQEAGVPITQAFVADVAAALPQKLPADFSLIICDAPCTGSGTWSRTPEQLAYFKKQKIPTFAAIQKKISINAATHLKKAGLLFYITCSVFKEENEGVVEALQQETKMELLCMQYLQGYHQKADTMFVAVLKKVVTE